MTSKVNEWISLDPDLLVFWFFKHWNYFRTFMIFYQWFNDYKKRVKEVRMVTKEATIHWIQLRANIMSHNTWLYPGQYNCCCKYSTKLTKRSGRSIGNLHLRTNLPHHKNWTKSKQYKMNNKTHQNNRTDIAQF